MADKADVLICGGGIIGLTIAKELLNKGYENIVILEKEKALGEHASGRNSGVLHAGIYYAPDSLKAQFCLKGNFLMKKYCREKDIPVLETGKVIVAKNKKEIPLLKELHKRAFKNGARSELVDEKQLKTIEPYAKTCGLALYSLDTAVINPKRVLANMEMDLISSGEVKILKGYEFRGLKGDDKVVTNSGSIKYNLFINAAGSYSDTVAHIFEAGQNYRIIPFKGTYRKLNKAKSYLVKGNIYPVPDISNPFLGVHFTRAVDGTVYIGPTAIPAFGRENYGILKGIDREVFKILSRNLVLFFNNCKFRKVSLKEPRKYSSGFFFREVKDLVENLNPEDIEPSSKVGIRPQLVDWGRKELVMDFVVLKSEIFVHILNTVSPGFTSSMAFAEFLAEKYLRRS